MKFSISEYGSKGRLIDFLVMSLNIYLEFVSYDCIEDIKISVPNPNKGKLRPATILYSRNYLEGFSKQKVRIDKKRRRNK